MTKNSNEKVVFESGGKQYIATLNTIISVEKLEHQAGDTFNIDKVLLYTKDDKTEIGAPYLDLTLKAEVLAEEKDKKVRVFKFKKKTGFKKTQGHRQIYSTIKILSINKKKASSKASAKTTSTTTKTKDTKEKASK